MITSTTIEDLMHVSVQIEELVNQARRILEDTKWAGQADEYWLSHIESALGTGTYSMCSMRDTIREIEECSCSECSGELKDSYCEDCKG